MSIAAKAAKKQVWAHDALQLSEYSYNTGCGRYVGTDGYVEALPWADCNDLDTYSVQRGSVVLAEFEGRESCRAYRWLVDHADYDGRDGVKAWKGICAWCDKALVDGECDCPDGRGRNY